MLNSLRLRAASLVAVGAMTVAFGAPGAAAETVSPDVRAATSAAESQRLVLSSPFGEARSRVVGTYGQGRNREGLVHPTQVRESWR